MQSHAPPHLTRPNDTESITVSHAFGMLQATEHSLPLAFTMDDSIGRHLS